MANKNGSGRPKKRGRPTKRRTSRKSDTDEIDPLLVTIVVGIVALAVLVKQIQDFYNAHKVEVLVGGVAVIAVGLWLLIKVVMPRKMVVDEKTQKDVEMERNIVRKKLQQSRAKELESLSEDEQNYLLDKWADEAMKNGGTDSLLGKTKNIYKDAVPPLNSSQTAEIKSVARYTCENPNCKETEHLEVHHIIPRENGGTNKHNNLIALCRICHTKAHGNAWSREDLKRWIRSRGG